MANRRLPFVTIASSITVLVLSVVAFRSSPNPVNADPLPRQMMGGRMGGHQGMQGRMHGMTGDNVPPGVTPQDLPAPNSKGAKLTVRYCTQCHNLASPAMHTANEWVNVVDQMFRRMSMASTRGMMRMGINMPSTEQQKQILAYFKAHALKSISPSALASPDSPGAVAYKRSCSECHALPNPKLHRATGWPAIVRKMQSYARPMGKEVITDHEARMIEGFLVRQSKR